MSNPLSSLLPSPPAGDFLEVRGGPEDGRQIALDAAEVWLGTSEEAAVPLLLDERIEPLHCRVARIETQLFTDDGSSGGTFVNERRLDGRTELADGDRLRLGATKMILRKALTAASPAATHAIREEH